MALHQIGIGIGIAIEIEGFKNSIPNPTPMKRTVLSALFLLFD